MARIQIRCSVCGYKKLNTRESKEFTLTAVSAVLFCPNCFSKMRVSLSVEAVYVADYRDEPNALRFNKPLRDVDERQLEIPQR